MALPASERNDYDGRFRLNESYWSLLLKMASNLNIKYGVFIRRSAKLNINLHSNQRIVEQAKKLNMSVEDFAQYSVQQMLEADTDYSCTNETKEGTQND